MTMSRCIFWVALGFFITVSPGFAQAAASGVACPSKPSLRSVLLVPVQSRPGTKAAPPALQFQPQPIWEGSCTAFDRCVCQCKQQSICCNNCNGCVDGCDEYACEDDCFAYIDDGTVCGAVYCSVDPFCNAP